MKPIAKKPKDPKRAKDGAEIVKYGIRISREALALLYREARAAAMLPGPWVETIIRRAATARRSRNELLTAREWTLKRDGLFSAAAGKLSRPRRGADKPTAKA